MGSGERRKEIMRILCRRRHETIPNLASEFGVCKRTIARDISILSMVEPIYTLYGRYDGGVYVMDNYYIERMYMNENELDVLNKLYLHTSSEEKCDLNAEEVGILSTIISRYTRPVLQH